MALEWNGDAILANLTAQTEAALFAGAEHIRSVAAPLAPKDTGDLRISLTAEADQNQAVVYSDSVYAARQHEEVGWAHEDGQAKYLETAVNSAGDAAIAVVAAKLGGALGG